MNGLMLQLNSSATLLASLTRWLFTSKKKAAKQAISFGEKSGFYNMYTMMMLYVFLFLKKCLYKIVIH